MRVKAKYQFGYKGKAISGGEIFEIDEEDLPQYRNDIELINSFRAPTTKTGTIKKIKRKK